MSKHYQPQFDKQKYHCPYCGVFAKQYFFPLPSEQGRSNFSGIWRSHCSHCEENCFWHSPDGEAGVLLIPGSYGAPTPNEHMPPDIRADYDEAASILPKSPRGAAALLRLSVQKLMVHLGMPGDNINNDIKKLVAAGLPVQIQQALDYCRVVGNNAVHPGELSLEDTPDMAWTMFEMINTIVQLRIAAPKQLEELYAQLPQGARDAIAKRDTPK